MQRVDGRPGKLALAHAIHGGRVARAPGVGEGRPVDPEALALAEELALADERAAPVHHRAEHVERQGLHHYANVLHVDDRMTSRLADEARVRKGANSL